MSIPVPTSIWWDEHLRRFVARHRGVEIQADGHPQIPGLPEHIVLLEYQFKRGELRISAERRCELPKKYCDLIDEFLENAAQGARRAFGLED